MVKIDKKKVLKHISQVGIGIICFALMTSPGWAIDPAAPVKTPKKVLKIQEKVKKVCGSSVSFVKNLFFDQQLGRIRTLSYLAMVPLGALLGEIVLITWLALFDKE